MIGRRFLTCAHALVALAAYAVSSTAGANIITYSIEDYQTGGYSASWVHTADGCERPSDLDLAGDGEADSIFTCGSLIVRADGYLEGDWDDAGEVLTLTDGFVNGARITGGSIGGAFYDTGGEPLWHMDIANWGTFIFEEMAINVVTPEFLRLWGQSLDTYDACWHTEFYCGGEDLGLDIFAKVPEPGSLALLGLGLVSLAGLRRRRRLS